MRRSTGSRRPAVRRLEHLLVATGALPPRDPALARLERWIEELLAARDDEPALRTFAHWIVLRRYRRKSHRAPLNDGRPEPREGRAAQRAQRSLDWLAERDTPLAELQAGRHRRVARRPARRPAHRSGVRRWAMARGADAKARLPSRFARRPHPAGHRPRPRRARPRLLHDPGIAVRDRVAGVLIVLFAQPVGRIARLTVDDITVVDESVAVRFGDTAITLPEPLASDLRVLIADRRGCVAAAVPAVPVAVPGRLTRPARSANACSAADSNASASTVTEARRTALLQLAGQIPAALVADLLGVHVATATQWAQIAGRPWGDYPALRAQ